MKPISERRGLRFPDEFLVRHFFRSRRHQNPGRVLELGCGNGSNLECYAAFGHRVTGVDISQSALDDACWNFEGEGTWMAYDLGLGLPRLTAPFDTVLMASSMYYIPRDSFITCLQAIRPLVSADATFFIRMRTLSDYRFARGIEVERNGFRLATPETGEDGLLNVFYSEHELVDILRSHLGAEDMKTLRVQFESERTGGGTVLNSDILAYGIIRR